MYLTLGTPGIVFLGASAGSKAAYEQMSHVCMPWPCLSLMQLDQAATPDAQPFDEERTEADSFRARRLPWDELVSLCIEAAPLIAMDARAVTEHLLTELAIILSRRRDPDTIYIVRDDGGAPMSFVEETRRCRYRITASH
jgi:hypothetical protein